MIKHNTHKLPLSTLIDYWLRLSKIIEYRTIVLLGGETPLIQLPRANVHLVTHVPDINRRLRWLSVKIAWSSQQALLHKLLIWQHVLVSCCLEVIQVLFSHECATFGLFSIFCRQETPPIERLFGASSGILGSCLDLLVVRVPFGCL